MGDEGDFWRDVKAAKKAHTKDVFRVTQSPLNARRWCLSLYCGHEVWVTRHGRPKIKAHFCETCARASTIVK